MWQAIWQLSARRVLAWHLPVFLLLVGYTLFTTHPLGIDPVAVMLGVLQGWVLAFRLFRDSPRVSPFIFSLPFSRTRLFFYRWLIGLLLQAITLIALFVIVASGLRQAFQLHMVRSYWFPMVRWYELASLWPIALASLTAYQATCFLLLRGRLRGDAGRSKLKTTANGLFLAWAGFIAISAVGGFVSLQLQGPSHGNWDSSWPATALPIIVLSSYTILLVVTTTLASLYCLRCIEINS